MKKNTQLRWTYQADENPKRKHHWENDYPGFYEKPMGKGQAPLRIGKCPRRLAPAEETQALLDELLNDGILYSPPSWRQEHPKRIYIVHEGWLYRATPTNPGRSYHAFPEDFETRKVPPSIRGRIREVARQKGCEAEIEKWL